MTNVENNVERKTTAIKSAKLANLLINKGERVLGINKNKVNPSRLVFIFEANDVVIETSSEYITEKGEINARNKDFQEDLSV